jgi:nucleotide-binding universal stress UspA family protein
MRWRASRAVRVEPEIVQRPGPADRATVVVGVDGVALGAFRWACLEGRRLGGRVVVVLIGTAAGLGLGSVVAGDLAVDLVGGEAGRRLLTELLREADGLELTFIDAPGDPVDELLRVARDVHADLLVVGESRKRRHRLTGAVGARLAARRREPVIAVVPAQAE